MLNAPAVILSAGPRPMPEKSPPFPNAKSVVTAPPDPNPESRAPSDVYLTRRGSNEPEPTAQKPPTTRSPELSMATLEALAPVHESNLVSTAPPEPNPESRVPSGRRRSIAKPYGGPSLGP